MAPELVSPADADAPPGRRPRELMRRAWPLAIALLLLPGIVVDYTAIDDAPRAVLAIVVVLPLAAAVAYAGIAIGGRRGLAASALLGALGVWCAWWFGWGVEASGASLSVSQGVEGLAEASAYYRGLLRWLWPLVLAAAIVVGVSVRLAGGRWWRSLGMLTVALVVLAWPARGSWDDGCNLTTGAAPAVLGPAVPLLMDHGVRVLPSGYSTLVACFGMQDREWGPFWRGEDGLPLGHGLSRPLLDIQVPRHLAGTPTPVPAPPPVRRLEQIALVRSARAGRRLSAVVRVDISLMDELASARSRWVFRLGGQKQVAAGVKATRNPLGVCFQVDWAPPPGQPAPPIFSARSGERLRITYERAGRVLAAGTAPVEILPPKGQGLESAFDAFERRFGCPPFSP